MLDGGAGEPRGPQVDSEPRSRVKAAGRTGAAGGRRTWRGRWWLGRPQCPPSGVLTHHSPGVGVGGSFPQVRTPKSWLLQGAAGVWFLACLTSSSHPGVSPFSVTEALGCGRWGRVGGRTGGRATGQRRGGGPHGFPLRPVHRGPGSPPAQGWVSGAPARRAAWGVRSPSAELELYFPPFLLIRGYL